MAREACFSGVTPGGLSRGEMVRMRQTKRDSRHCQEQTQASVPTPSFPNCDLGEQQ